MYTPIQVCVCLRKICVSYTFLACHIRFSLPFQMDIENFRIVGVGFYIIIFMIIIQFKAKKNNISNIFFQLLLAIRHSNLHENYIAFYWMYTYFPSFCRITSILPSFECSLFSFRFCYCLPFFNI